MIAPTAMDREPLDRRRRRGNTILMLVLATFVVGIYAASFWHLELESDEKGSSSRAGMVTKN